MNIFITGGTGFIGSHTVKKLAEEGHKLLLLSRTEEKHAKNEVALRQAQGIRKVALRPLGTAKDKQAQGMKNIEYLKGDLGNSNAWEKNVKAWKPNTVLHMAWEGIPGVDAETSIKNLMSGLNLLRIAKEARAKTFIGLGSSLEYGGLKGRVSEDMQGTPPNALYGAKKALYEMGRHIAKEYGLQFIWVRPFFVYGPGQKKTSLIPSILEALHRGETLVLKNPNAAEDFIYVGDVASAVANIMSKCGEQEAVFNIGSGRLTSVRDIAQAVAKALGKPIPELPLSGTSSPSFYADISKIGQATGWEPSTRLEEGIQIMIS